MEARPGGLYGETFTVYLELTQEEPLYPNISNVVAELVVHQWLNWVCVRQSEEYYLGVYISYMGVIFCGYYIWLSTRYG